MAAEQCKDFGSAENLLPGAVRVLIVILMVKHWTERSCDLTPAILIGIIAGCAAAVIMDCSFRFRDYADGAELKAWVLNWNKVARQLDQYPGFLPVRPVFDIRAMRTDHHHVYRDRC